MEVNTAVVSTSTRNFNNRMGNGAQVYLGSAELAAACAVLGRIPTVAEYHRIVSTRIQPLAAELYRYLNFDQIPGFARGQGNSSNHAENTTPAEAKV